MARGSEKTREDGTAFASDVCCGITRATNECFRILFEDGKKRGFEPRVQKCILCNEKMFEDEKKNVLLKMLRFFAIIK